MSPPNAPGRPTDALANERTFLAWIRTALALAAFGFVIARFALFTREFSSLTHSTIAGAGSATKLGAAMAAAAVVAALYGSYRYVATARALRLDTVLPLSDYAAIAGGAFVAVVGIVVGIDLILIR